MVCPFFARDRDPDQEHCQDDGQGRHPVEPALKSTPLSSHDETARHLISSAAELASPKGRLALKCSYSLSFVRVSRASEGRSHASLILILFSLTIIIFPVAEFFLSRGISFSSASRTASLDWVLRRNIIIPGISARLSSVMSEKSRS